jgi:hypothetical protein
MDWKDIASIVGKGAPLLGTLSGGPPGALIGGMIASALGSENTPEGVSAAIANNPDAYLKLKELELNNKTKLEEIATSLAIAEINATKESAVEVNKTMQAEASSEHWQTYSWRPFIGFSVGVNILASSLLVLMVFVPTMFGVAVSATATANLPTILGALAALNTTTLPILGIASYFRGKMQADPAIPPAIQIPRK